MSANTRIFDKVADGRPRFGTFYCPMSPYIPWEWGLVFKECPLESTQRDMKECLSCRLRGTDNSLPKRRSGARKPKRKQENAKNRGKTEQGAKK